MSAGPGGSWRPRRDRGGRFECTRQSFIEPPADSSAFPNRPKASETSLLLEAESHLDTGQRQLRGIHQRYGGVAFGRGAVFRVQEPDRLRGSRRKPGHGLARHLAASGRTLQLEKVNRAGGVAPLGGFPYLFQRIERAEIAGAPQQVGGRRARGGQRPVEAGKHFLGQGRERFERPRIGIRDSRDERQTLRIDFLTGDRGRFDEPPGLPPAAVPRPARRSAPGG